MKGISAIIATILLLIMTIALAGTAYIYFTGIMTARVSKTIEVLKVSCKTNRTHSNITIIVANRGTDRIENGEIDVYINNIKQNEQNIDLDPIDPMGVRINTTLNTPVANKTTVLVASPSNSITSILWC